MSRHHVYKPLDLITLEMQIGNPMSRSDLQDAILDSNPLNLHKEVKSAAEESEKIPFSIIVVGDRGWHAGGISSAFCLKSCNSVCCHCGFHERQYKQSTIKNS